MNMKFKQTTLKMCMYVCMYVCMSYAQKVNGQTNPLGGTTQVGGGGGKAPLSQQQMADSLNYLFKTISPSYSFPNKYVVNFYDYLDSFNTATGNIMPPYSCTFPDPCYDCFEPNNCCGGICNYSSGAGGNNSNPTMRTTSSHSPPYETMMEDPYGNEIHFLATYGSDVRQRYYIYLPNNTTVDPNTPIVVLVHGGGWFSGPNPSTVNGFPFKFASKASNESLVKSLTDQGFVVVSLLYRLSKYGKDATEIPQNDVTISEQVADINSAILHIKTNFPICLNLNANSIQVLGESAGGHLALMWAYQYADLDYIKSVTSFYAPTNMNQYANYMKDKRKSQYPLITFNYNCGSDYSCILVCPFGNLPYFPFYFPFNDNNPFETQASVSPFICNLGSLDHTVAQINCDNGDELYCNASLKAVETYKMIQSAIAKNVNNPLTDADLLSISPYNALNTSRIVPTFILHGTADQLVPYEQATNGMSTKLANTGGLIATYTNLGDVVPDTYTGSKHLIKKYTGANHTFANGNVAQMDIICTQVRTDVVNWLNGHK